MSNKLILFIIVLLLAFAGLINLARFLWNIPASIGSFHLPGWTGGLIYIVLAVLSTYGFKALAALSDRRQSDPSHL